MASSSAFLRSIRRISYNYSRKWTATGSGFYPRGAPHMNLSTVSEAVSSSPSKISKNSSPWLMLPPPPPPASEGGVMSFKFYSLAENKVLTLTGSEEKELTSDLMPDRRFSFRGSSLGWLALLNPHNLDLFLYNPISRRHIKLPPIRDLPNFPKHCQRDVTKVILSCSPDEDDENCRAVIIYNCLNSLAFCCPGHSEKWTPFGEMRMWWDGRILSRGCRDCVYSTRQKVFFCLTNFGELESWDLQDPSSPRVLNIKKIRDTGHFNFVGKHQCINLRELRPKELGRPVKHLVVADQDLLLVTQYIMEHVGPDGSYVDCLDVGSRKCPYRTVSFDVHKCDLVKGCLDHMMPNYSTLAGLVLFIGFHSHSVALPAAQFPELNPDSIFFTDTVRTETLSNCDDDGGDDQPFGGHDIGIFDFEDKTVSSCYYPCDVGSLKRIMPPPMWFFPSLGRVG